MWYVFELTTRIRGDLTTKAYMAQAEGEQEAKAIAREMHAEASGPAVELSEVVVRPLLREDVKTLVAEVYPKPAERSVRDAV
jgi:hypothetical protein